MKLKRLIATSGAMAVLGTAALAMAVTVLEILAYNRQPGGVRLFYDRSGVEVMSLRAGSRSRGFSWAVYREHTPVMPGHRTEVGYDRARLGGAIQRYHFKGYNPGSSRERPDTEQQTVEVGYWSVRLALIATGVLLLAFRPVRHQFSHWWQRLLRFAKRLLQKRQPQGFEVVGR